MNATQTVLAGRIFDRIASNAKDAVFLYTPQDQPLLLTFGPNHVSRADYLIHLNSDGSKFEISSKSPQQFALLMDHSGSAQKIRLVLYLDGNPNPALEYDAHRPGQMLEGEILIQTQDESKTHVATIFAGFDSESNEEPSNSLIIDGSKGIYTHFQRYHSMLTARFGKELDDEFI